MKTMSSVDRNPALRWIAPGAVLAAIAGVVAIQPMAADASSGLDPLTAEQLLVKMQQARPVPMSGTVTQRLDLGLPGLPGSMTGHSGTANLASLVAGKHTWRVWYGGDHQARLALLGQGSESDIVTDGRDLWVWASADKTARHYILPDPATRDAHGTTTATPSMPAPIRDPQAVAKWALAQIEPTTTVTTTSVDKVAGRSVYGLVLTPKSSKTLVSSVQICVDAENTVPLAVRVFSTKQANPAIDVAYSSVDFTRPDDAVFRFTPPKDTTVTTVDVATVMKGMKGKHAGTRQDGGTTTHPATTRRSATTSPDHSTVTGKGWDAVLAGRLPADAVTQLTGDGDTSANSPASLLQLLPRAAGTWGGGWVIDGTLFSVVLTDDGRYAAGAVAANELFPALAR